MNKSEYNYKYRLDLTFDEMEKLKNLLNNLKLDKLENALFSFNELKEIVNNPKEIRKSVKKCIAADKATEARIKQSKVKIQNAINILRMEGKEITAYQISKIGNVSFVTAQKYLNTINEK